MMCPGCKHPASCALVEFCIGHYVLRGRRIQAERQLSEGRVSRG